MIKPVAITGASGFVGSHAAALLLAQKIPVRALLRDGTRGSELARAGAEIITGDLADRDALARLVDGAGAVIHCAGAIAGLNRAAFDAVNVDGTRAIAAAAAAAHVARFVHVSSLAARAPQLSDYAASKRASEDALRAAAGGLSFVILRPPAVYGPGDRATLPLFAQLIRHRALLPGRNEQRISLIHVSDLADALVRMAGARAPSGSVHELHDGTPGGYSWNAIGRIAGAVEGHAVALTLLPRPVVAAAAQASALYGRLTGRAMMLTPGKVNELYHADWAAHEMLLDHHSDWRPQINFETGFHQTADWYRAQGWLPGSPRAGTSQPVRKHGETAR